MATIEGALIAKLITDVSLVAKRIWPDEFKQGAAMPGIVVTVVSEQEGITFEGAEDTTELRLQVDVYARTKPEASSVARQVSSVLHGYRGTTGGVVVQGVFKEGRRDSFEGAAPDRVYRCSQDFTVWAVRP